MNSNEKLTKLEDLVKVGSRETTILAEFQRQQGGEPTTTPTVRGYSGTGMDRSPSDVCIATLWNETGETATFRISHSDLDYLRGQGAQVGDE